MSPPIRFCFDFISPYAYIAWTRVHDLGREVGREVEPVPVLFAALLNHHGTKGPAEVPARRLYTFKDASRKAHRFGLPPLVPPPSHPFNPLLALRVASLPLEPEARRRLIDVLYRRTWAEGRGVDSPEAILDAAARVGLDGRALIEEASTPEGKDRLRRQTDDAIAAGTFGVPTLLVDGEVFWGVDSLEYVRAFIEGDDPVPRDAALRWGAIAPSAERRAK